MPTANVNTGNSFRATLSYVYQEEKSLADDQRPVILEQQNVFGTTTAGQGRVMRTFAVERPSIKKPVMHLQINFHPDEKIENAIAQKAIHSILADLGVSVDNAQYVIVQHRDKSHNHYHVVLNRVCLDQSIIETHRVKDRLQVACDKVEQRMNLRATSGRTVVYDPSSAKGYVYTNKKEDKLSKPIQDKNTAVKAVKIFLQEILSKILGLPGVIDPESLKQALDDHKVSVVYRANKKGITGISFRYDNIACTGKDIGFSWTTIEQELSNKMKTAIATTNSVDSSFGNVSDGEISDRGSAMSDGLRSIPQHEYSDVEIINTYILDCIDKERITNSRSLVDFLIKKGHVVSSGSDAKPYDLATARIQVLDVTVQGQDLDLTGVSQKLEAVYFDEVSKRRNTTLLDIMSLETAIGKLKNSVFRQVYESLKQGSGLLSKDAEDPIFTMYVDQAVREVMRRIDPESNPWSTWSDLNYPTHLESSYKELYTCIPSVIEAAENRIKIETILYDKDFVQDISRSSRDKIEQEIYAERYDIAIDQIVANEIHAQLKQQGIESSAIVIKRYMSDHKEMANQISAFKSDLNTLIEHPVSREVLEDRLVKEYNSRIQGFIDEVKGHIKKGVFKIDYGSLILQNGLGTKDNKVFFQLDGASVERSIDPLKEFIKGIHHSLEAYNRDLDSYKQAINPILHNIHPIYRFTQGAKAKRAENERLLQIKENAIKPSLQINGSVLNKLLVSDSGNYAKRKTNMINHRKIEPNIKISGLDENTKVNKKGFRY